MIVLRRLNTPVNYLNVHLVLLGRLLLLHFLLLPFYLLFKFLLREALKQASLSKERALFEDLDCTLVLREHNSNDCPVNLPALLQLPNTTAIFKSIDLLQKLRVVNLLKQVLAFGQIKPENGQENCLIVSERCIRTVISELLVEKLADGLHIAIVFDEHFLKDAIFDSCQFESQLVLIQEIPRFFIHDR